MSIGINLSPSHYGTEAPPTHVLSWQQAPPPRSSSRQSQVTINTIDIEGLAARNEQRKRKLEAILQGRQNQRQQEDRGSALDNFMKTFNEREPGAVTPGGVTPSTTSLECETVFQTLPSSD